MSPSGQPGPPPPPPPPTAPPTYPSYPQGPPPPYGQQPFGPPGYGYEQPPPSGTNGFAIASLVFGIIGGCLFGVIFGIIALVKINRTGQKGRGLAIAGLVLSGLWFVGVVVAGIAGGWTEDADRDPSGAITDGGDIETTDLAVGDCVNDLKADTDVLDVPAVTCTEPHQGEVYAVLDFTGDDFPGDDALAEQAQRRCIRELRSVAPEVVRDRAYSIFWFQPTDFTWARGDRDLACLATTEDKRPGSILD